jgi:hypothetical protein
MGQTRRAAIIGSQSRTSSEEGNALHLVGLEGNPVLRPFTNEPNN